MWNLKIYSGKVPSFFLSIICLPDWHHQCLINFFPTRFRKTRVNSHVFSNIRVKKIMFYAEILTKNVDFAYFSLVEKTLVNFSRQIFCREIR